MKQFFSILIALFVVTGIQAKTNDFNFDSKKVNAEFGQLNKVEDHVVNNVDATVESAQATAEDITLDTTTASVTAGELPAGIPAFWWGFCLGWVGLLVVYIVTDNDKSEVKKAFKGCIIATLIWVVAYVLIFVVSAASTAL